MKRFAIFGASGCGRGVMPLARQQLQHLLESEESDLVFVDDAPLTRRINGHRVLTTAEWLSEPASNRSVCIAIANSKIRERLALECAEKNMNFFEVRAPNVIQMDDVQLGEGAVLSPFVTLTSNIRIGRHFHANLYSYIEHDCVVGDYVTLAPGVMCNGNVVIEDHVYIGAGAVIKQGKPGAPIVIGHGSVIGMGAVVTKSISPGDTVIGNPARVYAKG